MKKKMRIVIMRLIIKENGVIASESDGMSGCHDGLMGIMNSIGY